MKSKIFFIVLLVTVFVIPQYLPAESPNFRQEGIASWYGREFEGRPTASGEIFDSSQLTAAHPTLPFGTLVVVTNQHNNRSVTVRVNDRGPFTPARIIDVSRAAAEQLDMIATGTAPVIVETVERIAVSPPVITPAPVIHAVPVAPAPPAIVHTEAPVINNFHIAEPVVQQPVGAQIPFGIRLAPQIEIVPNQLYRLQIGSYRVARNAVETFQRLRNAGLNPAYERFSDSASGDFFRVVLAGIPGSELQAVTEKLRISGFSEALIRVEN